MKLTMRILAVSVVLVVIAGGLIWSFLAGRKDQAAEAQSEAPVQAPSRVTSENGRAVLAFDAASQKANGIVTTVLPAARQQIESQATGDVVQLQPLLDLQASYNTPRTDLIRARANARVQTITLNVAGGDAEAFVRAGTDCSEGASCAWQLRAIYRDRGGSGPIPP
jgi:hypothetical protein